MESNPMDIYGSVGQLGNTQTFPAVVWILLLKKLFFLNSFRSFSLCIFTVLCVTYGHFHTSTWRMLSIQPMSWLQGVIYILTHCLIQSPATLTHSRETLSDATSYKLQVVSKPSPWDWFPDKMIKTKSHLCSLKGHQEEQDNCKATDGLVFLTSKYGQESHSNELLSCMKGTRA